MLVAFSQWFWLRKVQIQLVFWSHMFGAPPQCLSVPQGFVPLFQPLLEDDVLLEGPAFPISSTFVQEFFQAQYRYGIL